MKKILAIATSMLETKNLNSKANIDLIICQKCNITRLHFWQSRNKIEMHLLADRHGDTRLVVLFFNHHNGLGQKIRHEAREGLQHSSGIPLHGRRPQCATITLSLHPSHCRLHCRSRIPENLQERAPGPILHILPCHQDTITTSCTSLLPRSSSLHRKSHMAASLQYINPKPLAS